MGRDAGHVALAERDSPGVGGHEARDAVEERRLARAIRPDQRDQLSALDRQIHAVDRGHAQEAFHEPVHGEERHQAVLERPLRRSADSSPSGHLTTIASSKPP